MPNVNESLLATLPHRFPILMLESCPIKEDDWAVITLSIPKDSLFLKSDGTIEEACFLEMMAQCFASYANLSATTNFGYLAQVKNLNIFGHATAETILTVKTKPTFQLGNIIVVQGIVVADQEVLAQAEFKVFHPGQN